MEHVARQVMACLQQLPEWSGSQSQPSIEVEARLGTFRDASRARDEALITFAVINQDLGDGCGGVTNRFDSSIPENIFASVQRYWDDSVERCKDPGSRNQSDASLSRDNYYVRRLFKCQLDDIYCVPTIEAGIGKKRGRRDEGNSKKLRVIQTLSMSPDLDTELYTTRNASAEVADALETRHDGLPSVRHVEVEEKDRLLDIDILGPNGLFDIRISVSREIQKQMEQPQVQRIIADGKTKVTRKKRRFSYTILHAGASPLWTLDLTTVNQHGQRRSESREIEVELDSHVLMSKIVADNFAGFNQKGQKILQDGRKSETLEYVEDFLRFVEDVARSSRCRADLKRDDGHICRPHATNLVNNTEVSQERLFVRPVIGDYMETRAAGSIVEVEDSSQPGEKL